MEKDKNNSREDNENINNQNTLEAFEKKMAELSFKTEKEVEDFLKPKNSDIKIEDLDIEILKDIGKSPL